MKKQNFRYDFGEGNIVEFAPFNLGELRRIGEHLEQLKAKAAQSPMNAITDLVPFMTAAAQRVSKEMTQDRLEALLDMYNYNEVFRGMIANSYGGAENAATGEGQPVQ